MKQSRYASVSVSGTARYIGDDALFLGKQMLCYSDLRYVGDVSNASGTGTNVEKIAKRRKEKGEGEE